MTITLAPQVETRLRRKADRVGQDANALADALLLEALDDEVSDEELRDEHHQLVAIELRDGLSDPQSTRLNRVRQELDARDAQGLAAQAMSQRLGETGQKLDEMLAILRSLPVDHQETIEFLARAPNEDRPGQRRVA